MTRNGSTCAALGLAAVALLAAPDMASAQGSAVYTQSACMNARNGAGIASTCTDGSAIYYNPAAIARQNGAVSFGATVIDNAGTFVYDTTEAEISRAARSLLVPHGWATWRPMERLGVGLGVFAPYGLSIDWPVCPVDQSRCGTGFEGRFVGYDQSLRGLYFQPTVAYDLIPGRLAIGGGIDIVKGDVEINRRLDLAEQSIEIAPGVRRPMTAFGIQQGTDFADVSLEGDAWGVTGHAAVLLNVTSAVTIGARYMHSVELPFEGTADFTPVATRLTIGPLPPLAPSAGTSLDDVLEASGIFAEGGAASDQDFTASITLPAQAVAGIAIQIDPTLRIMADYQWTQWSEWDVVPVQFGDEGDDTGAPDETLILDYQDASTIRAGIDFAFSDRIMLRGGFTFAQAAAKDASVSPFLPDSDRTFLSGGFGYRVSERLGVDFFGMSANAAARRGRVVNREDLGDTAEELNEGIYTADGQLYGVTLIYHFGGPR